MLLLRSLIVFMEEHITMELHEVMRSLLKTIGDPDIGKGMCENASLLGRFVDPEAFVPLIVPRIRGDDDAEFTQVSLYNTRFWISKNIRFWIHTYNRLRVVSPEAYLILF